MRYFCTYFDFNYLSRGLALYRSLNRHSKEPFTLWVLCFENQTHQALKCLDLPAVRLIRQEEFEKEDDELLQAKQNRSRVEYYWTCTPSLPLYIFRSQPDVDLITYLDADLYFFSDPTPIFDELGEGSVSIIEHRFPPELTHLEVFGRYNVGTLIFRKDENGLAALNWWRDQCLQWCYSHLDDGKYGDQKYLDDWPARFPGVTVLQHQGAGLAPWNSKRYQIRKLKERITVDGQPLIFYHFHSLKLVHSLACQPTTLNYEIEAGTVTKLYQPYVQALKTAQALIDSVIPDTSPSLDKSLANLIRGLLTEGWLLTRSEFLARVLWSIYTHNVAQRDLMAKGFVAHQEKDLKQAQQAFLSAVKMNPLVLRNIGIISILLESWLGTDRMNQLRGWRRKYLPQ